jgi:membrane-associated phospholipid phosphatase
MFGFEWLSLAYAGTFALVTVVAPRGVRRGLPMLVCVAAVALILLASLGPDSLRLFLPNLYLVLGYWIPALLITADPLSPEPSWFERWLSRTDERCRGACPALPAILLLPVETAYLACYPIVPVSMGIVWVVAGPEAVPRYWMTVLLAGFTCYASLPWLVSRPPAKTDSHASGAVKRLNALVLSRVSHKWTTFPSGHAAVAWAAAFAVARECLVAGVALAVVAAGVSVGAAAGRYHYVIDVLLGLLVAVIVAVIT